MNLSAWKKLGSTKRFYQFCTLLIPICLSIGILLMLYGLYAGLWIAPADYQQGEGFRMIYVHVPCAFLSLFLYAMMGSASLIYLIWRVKLADIMAYCLAPIGALITLIALVTGALWGKPMWGTWWIWDARLTSELILFFLYIGYMMLYQSLRIPKMAANSCAILAVVGLIDLPIIHYSVNWWNTLHQGATLIRLGKPNIDGSMIGPLLGMLLGLLLYLLSILFIRMRTEILKREAHTQWVLQPQYVGH